MLHWMNTLKTLNRQMQPTRKLATDLHRHTSNGRYTKKYEYKSIIYYKREKSKPQREI
jgi:hypothetical protein